MPIFDNFFSKWSQMKTNEDKDMKPTLKGHNYTKFSYRERSSLLSHSSLEYMYFKGRTEVEVGDLIFCREIFPYLESSLVIPKERRATKLSWVPFNECSFILWESSERAKVKKIQQYLKSYFLQPGPHMPIISILLQLKGIGVACNLKKGHKELSFFY